VLVYLARRVAYGFATVIGVLLLLFALFFLYASPTEMARRAVGDKAPPEALAQWIHNHGYDRPRLWNPEHPLDTLLVDHFRRMLSFDFGRSDADDSPISGQLRRRMLPSLMVTVPLFVAGLVISVGLALFVAYFRETYIDRAGVVLCVLAMSVSILLYIIGGQYLVGKVLRWFPISGFDPTPALVARFLALPWVVGLLGSVGGDVRFYRTVFVEETGRVMLQHVLRNAMIQILTRVVVQIPFLFTGALLLESFFGIPGLGSMTVDAINGNDFSTLRVMVFIGTVLFVLGQIATDVGYTLVDPRVRLE
jgi:peptide/nickel transport system permease protein